MYKPDRAPNDFIITIRFSRVWLKINKKWIEIILDNNNPFADLMYVIKLLKIEDNIVLRQSEAIVNRLVIEWTLIHWTAQQVQVAHRKIELN